ncbi:MAG: hypothetical protein ACPF9K_06450 [Neptuniibacter sp.]
MYQLVKDFHKEKIIFYWIDKNKKRISPPLPSLNHAKDWLIAEQFASYEGNERREPKVDRRRTGKFEANCRRKHQENGRRIPDKPIKVDINIADKKIEAMLSENSPNQE